MTRADEPSEITPEEEIDPWNVKELLDEKQIVLIDCREPNEYETARIEGAILLPMSQWHAVGEQLSALAGKRIVVHCHHGVRSLRITRWLRANGYSDAQSMRGGIEAWSLTVDACVARY